MSDAFEEVEGGVDVNMELIVSCVNINKGRNPEIVGKCEPLEGYVEFVDIVRKIQGRTGKEKPGMNKGMALEAAIAEAVTYCKAHGILKEFFENLLPEEVNMLATEWKLEDALVIEREEGREEGFEKARQEDKDCFLNLINNAASLDELKNMFETSFLQQPHT